MEGYRIENLEVYRDAVALGAEVYSLSIPQQAREEALSLVLNLASGLGFWEKEQKEKYFRQSKEAATRLYPLIQISRKLGYLTDTQEIDFLNKLQKLTREVGGLLRQAMRREA